MLLLVQDKIFFHCLNFEILQVSPSSYDLVAGITLCCLLQFNTYSRKFRELVAVRVMVTFEQSSPNTKSQNLNSDQNWRQPPSQGRPREEKEHWEGKQLEQKRKERVRNQVWDIPEGLGRTSSGATFGRGVHNNCWMLDRIESRTLRTTGTALK